MQNMKLSICRLKGKSSQYQRERIYSSTFSPLSPISKAEALCTALLLIETLGSSQAWGCLHMQLLCSCLLHFHYIAAICGSTFPSHQTAYCIPDKDTRHEVPPQYLLISSSDALVAVLFTTYLGSRFTMVRLCFPETLGGSDVGDELGAGAQIGWLAPCETD